MLVGQQNRTQGLYSSLFRDVNQAKACIEFPGLVRQTGKPWAVLSFKTPLYVELLNGLCSLQCAMVTFPCWTGWRLYSVMAGLWIAGEAAIKPVKLFVVLTQADLYPSSLTEQSYHIFSANYWLCMSSSWFKHCWIVQLPVVGQPFSSDESRRHSLQ